MKAQLSFDSTLTDQGQKLLQEVESFVNHPRAAEILLNDWLHDGSLPIPSPELISYFAFRLLTGGVVNEAAALSRNELANKIVEAFRKEDSAQRCKDIERVRRRLAYVTLSATGKKGTFSPHMPEWLPVLDAFLYPEILSPRGPKNTKRDQGVRILARGIMEAMMLRAVFCLDVPRMEALSSTLRIIRAADEIAPPHHMRIAAEVLRWVPWLEDRLRRLPTKAEFKVFLETAYPDKMPATDDQAPYTKAFKLIGYEGPPNHNRKMDRGFIVTLGNEVKSLSQ